MKAIIGIFFIFLFLVISPVSAIIYIPAPGFENMPFVPLLAPPQYHAVPQFPQMNASWDYIYNPDGTIDLSVKIDDPSPSSYSVNLGQYRGIDPGPNADFYSPTFTLKTVPSGTNYLNVKKEINSEWSTIAYWTVEIPQWTQPTESPTPEITANPINTNNDFSNLFSYLVFGVVVSLGTAYIIKSRQNK